MSKTKQFQKKRSDTKISSIEEQYGVDFRVRSDMQLGEYLKKQGLTSLSRALEHAEKISKK